MLLLLIVLPCAVVGTAAVALLDRSGLLPRVDEPMHDSPGPSSRAPARLSSRVSPKPMGSLARPLSLATILVMAIWILAWIAVLIVGLNLIISSS